MVIHTVYASFSMHVQTCVLVFLIVRFLITALIIANN